MELHPGQILIDGAAYWTQAALARQLRSLGIGAGDVVMVHASLRAVGAMPDGADTLIAALLAVLEDDGTLIAYVGWQQVYEDAMDESGRVPADLKPHMPPFDPAASRANRGHGALAEAIRTTPGAQRSANPSASFAAIGAQATWFTADHPLDYGYGDGSPYAKLVAAGGKVLMLGTPYNRLSVLHYAEHLADIPGKQRIRFEVPLLASTPGGDGTVWRMIEEFETDTPVAAWLPGDCFVTVVTEFLESGGGNQGKVGDAGAVLIPATKIVDFTVAWLEALSAAKA